MNTLCVPETPASRRPYFYLGTHRARHLEQSPVPLFVPVQALLRYQRHGHQHMPKARVNYALDSGGYSHIAKYGEWTISPEEYGGAVYRFMEYVGYPPDFAAPQDFMCEPEIIRKTGLTVHLHQELTVDSVLYLRHEFPHAPWIPVLQGYRLDDYLLHVEMYRQAGINLTAEPLVGLGSVCRRQSTAEIGAIVTVLHAMGIRLHGFGVKKQGLARYGHLLASSDSLAWSYTARREKIRLDGCDHRLCNNCLRYALQWRADTLAVFDQPAPQTFQQGLALDFGTGSTSDRAEQRQPRLPMPKPHDRGILDQMTLTFTA
ncbi:deazapurine DNA modification protein DpdA family protein [Saccharothrix hoggarensis]|uniref:DeoxyPurine in DNA protein A domain-containing protein n=1 Tax=Saccharothrix hoggarensis TaxID=913853 RepID=A0ABW3QGR1_9PSEU